LIIPNHEKPLDYFLTTQLRVNELRNSEVSAGHEISNGNSKGQQYAITNPITGRVSPTQVCCDCTKTKNRVLAQMAIGKDETDPAVERFLQSLQISEKA